MVSVSGLEATAQIGLSPSKMWPKENEEAVDASGLIVKKPRC